MDSKQKRCLDETRGCWGQREGDLKGSHPWEHPEGAHVSNTGLQVLLPVVELQLGRARLLLAVEKRLRQQGRTQGANPQQQIHGGRNGERLAL